MTPPPETPALIEAGDPDGLLRRIDELVDARSWADLAQLSASCRAAVERGKQLWPVALHADYRLALTAPAEFAGPTVAAEGGSFGFGPLTEVVALHHTWSELEEHLPTGPQRSLTAHELVIRGESIDPGDLELDVIGLPTRLQSWEPTYPLAEYESHRAGFPAPEVPALDSELSGTPGAAMADESVEALLTLTSHWTTGSNGRSEAVLVEGSAADAVATLGVARAPATEVPAGTALAFMAWAAASGAAHGRRRGMAAGRFDAWWALAAVSGLDEIWPPEAEALGRAAAEIRWYVWSPPLPDTGWALHLAAHDELEGLGWALSAVDAG